MSAQELEALLGRTLSEDPLERERQLFDEMDAILSGSSAEEMDVERLDLILELLDELSPLPETYDPDRLWQKIEQKVDTIAAQISPEKGRVVQSVPAQSAAQEKRRKGGALFNWLPTSRAVKVAVCFFLCFGLMSSAGLAASADLRSVVFDWVRKEVDGVVLYEDAEHKQLVSSEIVLYQPTWVPERFGEGKISSHDLGVDIYYPGEDQYLYYTCSTYTESGTGIVQLYETENCNLKTVRIGEAFGDLYIETRAGHNSVLIWSEGNLLFSISGQLTEEEFLKMANSLVEVEQNNKR